MAKARKEFEWSLASSIMASAFQSQGLAITAGELNPMAEAVDIPIIGAQEVFTAVSRSVESGG